MRVPILNTYLDVVAEVAAEFIIVRPFVHPGVASTNVQMYWKQTTTVHACQGPSSVSTEPPVLTGCCASLRSCVPAYVPACVRRRGTHRRQIADGGSTAQRKDGRGGLLVTGSSLVQEYTILPVQVCHPDGAAGGGRGVAVALTAERSLLVTSGPPVRPADPGPGASRQRKFHRDVGRGRCPRACADPRTAAACGPLRLAPYVNGSGPLSRLRRGRLLTPV